MIRFDWVFTKFPSAIFETCCIWRAILCRSYKLLANWLIFWTTVSVFGRQRRRTAAGWCDSDLESQSPSKQRRRSPQQVFHVVVAAYRQRRQNCQLARPVCIICLRLLNYGIIAKLVQNGLRHSKLRRDKEICGYGASLLPSSSFKQGYMPVVVHNSDHVQKCRSNFITDWIKKETKSP